MECGHRNGRRDDNRITNLRWITSKENWADKRRHGTALEGERSHMSKLTARQVRSIVSRRNRGESLLSIASRFGVSEQAIFRITKGQCWRSVTGIDNGKVY
jgi:hypothetical protein